MNHFENLLQYILIYYLSDGRLIDWVALKSVPKQSLVHMSSSSPLFIRGQIMEALLHGNKTQDQDLAYRFDVSESFICKLRKQYKEEGNCDIGTFTGRPKKITERDDRMIVRKVDNDRFASTLQVKQEIPTQPIDERTIRRRMNDVNQYYSYMLSRPTFQNERNRIRRFNLVIEHLHWSPE